MIPMSDSIDEAERAVNEALQDAFDEELVETVLMCNHCARTHEEAVARCKCGCTSLFWIDLFDYEGDTHA